MDVPLYNLQCIDSSYNDQLEAAIDSLSNQETDLCLISEDGEKISTHRSLVCLYSSSLPKYLNDVPCCNETNISIPVSSLAINNLLNVLSNGFVIADASEQLSDVVEAAKILGIEMKNVNYRSENYESNLDLDLDESYDKIIKSKPEVARSWDVNVIRQGRRKKKPKRTKTQKEENKLAQLKQFEYLNNLNIEQEDIKVDQEHVAEEDDAEKLLEEDDGFRKTYSCFCGKMFLNTFVLNRHMTTHSEEKPFSCDQCQKGFSQKYKLKVHLNNFHQMTTTSPHSTNQNSLNIEQEPNESNEEIIKTEPEIGKSRRKGKPKKSKTQKDEKRIADLEQLEYLNNLNLEPNKNDLKVNQEHATGEDDVKEEPVCEEDYVKQEPVAQENLLEEGDGIRKIEKVNEIVQRKGNKKSCSYCGKMFRDTYVLKRHMMTHTGEKPFACDQCEKIFTAKDKLKKHRNAIHHTTDAYPQSTKDEPIDVTPLMETNFL